ncbi:hypothetical protein MICAC_60007 [Microcystis aeruginosa PCC 9443]|uniref:Uncharacterized protein n=1 Tax=Microcystis aeruginosa PCC 9443 TaxID=1160281 RepID=I4GA44_MICAE|nr:hypothetical protein MICAC_60007 [Microcystis aeruginosa PCC 9443]
MSVVALIEFYFKLIICITIPEEPKKRTLANLSKLPDDIIDNLKLALKGALQSR